MPYGNYSFVIDSSFKPFTLQEMMVPISAYKEEYEKVEDAYDELGKKAMTLDYLAEQFKNNPDSRTAQIYKSYADELHKRAKELSNNGLSVSNRRALSNLKRRYPTEIGKLLELDATRKAQIKEQHALAVQDPTRLFSRDAASSTLDDYLDNPDIGYKSYSGALLTKQVAEAAASIAKGLSNYGPGRSLDGFTKTWIAQHGFTREQVAQAIQNPMDPSSSPVLNALIENVVTNSGIPQWGDPATINQAYAYARQGLWSAIGETKINSYTDEAAKLAAQEASQKRVANYTAGLQNSMNITPKFDRRNVRTTAEMAATAKDVEMLNKYGKYFVQNPETGNYSLTQEGMKEYKKPRYKYRGVYSTASNEVTTEFKEWLDSRGLSEMAQGRTGKYQSSILQGMIKRAANQNDTNTAGEYTGLIDSSQYDNVLGVLNRAAQEGKLKNYERKKKGNSYEFVPTDDVDVSSLTNADIKSAVPVYGIHGNFLEVTLKGGDRIVIPYNNLNTNYNTMVTGNVNDAYALELMKAKGMETFTYSDGRTVPIDIAITDALNQGYDNFMSGLGTSQAEPQKTTRGLYQIR